MGSKQVFKCSKKPSKLATPKGPVDPYPSNIARLPITSESFRHMFSSQPSSGGDSGRNTQSAPQAKALTKAKYLRGKRVINIQGGRSLLVRLVGHPCSETTLGSSGLCNHGLYGPSVTAPIAINAWGKVQCGALTQVPRRLYLPGWCLQIPTHSVSPSPPGRRSSGGWKSNTGHTLPFTASKCTYNHG